MRIYLQTTEQVTYGKDESIRALSVPYPCPIRANVMKTYQP